MTVELDMLGAYEAPIHTESRWQKAQRRLDALDALVAHFVTSEDVGPWETLQRLQKLTRAVEALREEKKEHVDRRAPDARVDRSPAVDVER